MTTKVSTFLQNHIDFRFWLTHFLPVTIALLLGPILAGLISERQYLYVVAILFAIPVALVLNRYPLIAVFVWIVFVPLVPADGNTTRYLYWIFHRALIPLAVGINLVSRALRLKKHPPLSIGLPEAIMVIYLLVGLFSFLFNKESLVSQSNKYLLTLYDRSFIPFTAYWLIRLTRPNDRDMERLFPIMLGMLLIETIVGLLLWFSPTAITLWQGVNHQTGARGVGTFGEANPYASALMFFMVFVLQYAMTKSSGLARRFYLVAVGLGFVCIFFTFSRASWVAGLVVISIFWYLYPKVVRPMVIAGVVVMVVLLSTVLQHELVFAIERLNSAQSANSRVILGNAGRQMFFEKPLLGWGYGTYDVHDWKFMERVGDIVPKDYEIKEGTSHNTFLTILAETGILGFGLYIFPFLWWGIKYAQNFLTIIKSNEPANLYMNWRFSILIWTTILFTLLAGQFIDLRFFWFTLGSLWMSLGIAANMTEYYDQAKYRQAPM